jgi:hypothetical protein
VLFLCDFNSFPFKEGSACPNSDDRNTALSPHMVPLGCVFQKGKSHKRKVCKRNPVAALPLPLFLIIMTDYTPSIRIEPPPPNSDEQTLFELLVSTACYLPLSEISPCHSNASLGMFDNYCPPPERGKATVKA